MQSSLRGRSNTTLPNHRQLPTNPQEFILRMKRWRGTASSSLWDTEHALTEQSKSHVSYPINFDRKQEKKLTNLIFMQQRLLDVLLVSNLFVFLMNLSLTYIKILVYHVCNTYFNGKYENLMLTSHKLLKKHSQYFCCCSTLFLAATPFYEERGDCTPFKGVKI